MSHNSTCTIARVLNKVGLYLLAGCLGLPVIALAQGESNGIITLYPNNTTVNSGLNANVVSQNNEIVTLGIPFADCTLYDSDNFRLFDNTDAQVRVYVETLMEWPASRLPCGATSIRVLKVQFEFDATGGAPVVYEWDLQGPRATADYSSGFDSNAYEIAHDNPIKGGLMEPRVYGINDPAYILRTELMPPTAPYTPGDYDDNYFPTMWDRFANQFDFTTSTAGNWLFDKTSALYRQAMRTGDVLQYREAYVSHEFYIDKVEVTGANTDTVDYCIGGFDYQGKADSYSGGGAGCDSKYVYTQNIRLHLALTGDDSWMPSDNGTPASNGVIDTRDEAWVAIADLLYTGSHRCPSTSSCQFPTVQATGFSEAYDEIADYYNERKPGLGLQTVLSSCQLTLDPTVCGWVDTIVNNMYSHQTNNPDGRGNLGYLAHSWHRHEGSFLPWIGELSTDYTNATSIVIDKTVANSPGFLVAGNIIRYGGATFLELISDPTENPNGSWNLELASPLTGSAGEKLRTAFIDTSSTSNGNNLLDIPTDRAFSPWMQSLIADGLWEYYFWTEDATQKAKVEALLLGFARGIAAYGIDGKRLDSGTKALVENAFGVTLFSTPFTAVGCGVTISPVPRYVGNDLMGDPEVTLDYMTYMLSNSAFSDAHTPEALFQLSLGLLFETDPQKKAAMKALADDMQNWFARHTCTAGNINYPPRAFSWQTKADPFGTYRYAVSQSQSQGQSTVFYSDDTFIESAASDGSITNALNITVVGAEFDTVGVLTKDTHYQVNGDLPGGLTPVVTAIGVQSAIFRLTGSAASHDVIDNVDNIQLVFLDAAFDNVLATQLVNSTKSGLAIEFSEGGGSDDSPPAEDSPPAQDSTLSYDSKTFVELNSNVGESTTILTVTLSDGETFAVLGDQMNPSHFSTANVPSNMAVRVTGINSTTATVELTGNATNHSADVHNLTVTFLDAAFNGGSAASVDGSSRNDLVIDFSDAMITYGSDTFSEAVENDGSTNSILSLDLTFDSFVNAVFEMGTHYTVSNIPPGFTPEVIRTGPGRITFALSGAAANHDNDNDLSNIQLVLTDAAFTNGDAGAVANATKSDIIMDFTSNADDGNENETPIDGGGGFDGVDNHDSLQVPSGLEFINTGTLTDVNNEGIIIGGMLRGEADNQGGILQDVTLVGGARVLGGVVKGRLLGIGSVSNTLLDLDGIDSGITAGPRTQVTSDTVRKVVGLDLTESILDESGIPDIDFPFLSDSEMGDLGLTDLTQLGLDDYFKNSSSITKMNADGSVILANDDLKKNSVIPVELSKVVTTNRPEGVALTNNGNLEIVSHGIAMEFIPSPLARIFSRRSPPGQGKKTVSGTERLELASAESSTITSDASLLEDGLINIQLGDTSMFLRFGWLATIPDTTPTALSEEGEASFELIGSSSDPASQYVIVHYPDNSTQTLIPFLDSLTEFGAIVSQYEASFFIDPLTGIIQFMDADMNIMFTAVPDVASQPAEFGFTGAVVESVGDMNGDGYPDFYFKTPVRTQLIYGLSP